MLCQTLSLYLTSLKRRSLRRLDWRRWRFCCRRRCFRCRWCCDANFSCPMARLMLNPYDGVSHCVYGNGKKWRKLSTPSTTRIPLSAPPYHAICGTTTWTSWKCYSVPSAIRSARSRRLLTYIKVHIVLLCACVYVCVCMCIWHCDSYPFIADTPVALLTCHAWPVMSASLRDTWVCACVCNKKSYFYRQQCFIDFYTHYWKHAYLNIYYEQSQNLLSIHSTVCHNTSTTHNIYSY